jgi:hypothetical protein
MPMFDRMGKFIIIPLNTGLLAVLELVLSMSIFQAIF